MRTARLFCLLLSAGFLLSAATSVGQVIPPSLGNAAGFTLFTAVGAFNNVGPSSVQGDIGTNAGVFTGFPPGVLTTGSSHVGDAAATAAATDVEAAYLFAAGIPGAAPQAGYGGTPAQTLLPGAYEVGAATTLAGDLVLDAQGDPNAVFFLRVSGALTTAEGSTVTLSGGALARNVYWQIGGLLTLGRNAVMRGTLLVDGAIILIEGARLQGRALSRAGAISMDTNLVLGPGGAGPLPVTLTSFSATSQERHVLVQWTTATEVNSRSFVVERSRTGDAGWTTVATLPAAGTSSATRQYRVEDNQGSAGTCYYRLRSNDLDGTFTYSALRTVWLAATVEQVACFPNPLLSQLTVVGAQPGSQLTLLDVVGKIRLQQRVSLGAGSQQVSTDHLAPGAYLLRLVAADGTTRTQQLQKR